MTVPHSEPEFFDSRDADLGASALPAAERSGAEQAEGDGTEAGIDLTPADKLAVDAWLARGGSAGVAGGDEATARLLQVGRLMHLLESGGPSLRDETVERTLAAIVGAAEDVGMSGLTVVGNETVDAVLCEQDVDALEAYLLASYDPARVTGSLRARAAQLERLGQLLSDTPTHSVAGVSSTRRESGRDAATGRVIGDGSLDAADGSWPGAQLLIEQTYQRCVRVPRSSMAEPPAAVRRGFSLADAVSIAAVLLIAGSVVWPVVSTYRNHSMRQACMSNFGQVASALGSYASDFRGSMPLASASLGGRWWDVGTAPERSNSANLFTLARTKYTSVPTLACDGNAACSRTVQANAMDWPSLNNVSYSYFVMFGRERPSIARNNLIDAAARPAQTVVLADRSPVILRAVNRETVFPLENSPNHNGVGQNALRLDGSAVWMSSPVVGGDNIWLPANLEEALRSIQQLRSQGQTQGTVPVYSRDDAMRMRAIRLEGTETPRSLDDSFVGP